MLSSLDDLAGKVSPGSGKDSPQQHFDNNANAATKIRHLNHIVHPYSRQDVAKEKWVLQGSSWTVEEELGVVFNFIISLSPSPSFTCRFTWQREVNDWMRVWDHPGKLIPPLLFYWKVIVIELQCSSSRWWCVVGKRVRETIKLRVEFIHSSLSRVHPRNCNLQPVLHLLYLYFCSTTFWRCHQPPITRDSLLFLLLPASKHHKANECWSSIRFLHPFSHFLLWLSCSANCCGFAAAKIPRNWSKFAYPAVTYVAGGAVKINI